MQNGPRSSSLSRCVVDSVEGVAALDAGVQSPLGVLVELGAARAGCRTEEQALAVADAVAAAPRLVLAGVEGYEGTLGADRDPATLAAVDAFLDRLRALAETLDARGASAGVEEVVVSAGGSAFFDRVAERLRPAIAGFGKRDAPYDLGLPVVREPAGRVLVEALNDQHAFLRDADGALRVGDVVVCGISHPCTAFDKWPLIGVVDDDDVVIGAVRTLF